MLFIIIHHVYLYAESQFGIMLPYPLSLILRELGRLMTSVFFIISGYGLFSSMKRENRLSCKYIALHLWKLLQPFLFIFTLDIIVYTINHSFDIELFIKNLFTLSLTNSGTLWFMKVIFLLYFFSFSIHHFIKTPYLRLFFIWGLCCLYALFAIKYLGSFWWNSVLCFPFGYTLAFFNTSQLYEQKKKHSRLFEAIVWGGGSKFIHVDFYN